MIRLLPMLAALVAAPLFSEDFQDNKADGWGAAGGEVRLSEYAGNVSMNLVGGGRSELSLRLTAPGPVVVRAAMAAQSLEQGDACIAEATADGETWTEVIRVERGRDDAVTLWRGAATLQATDRVRVRLRADGDANDSCWADDVSVEKPAAPARPATAAVLPAARLLQPGATGLVPASAFAPSAVAQAPAQPLEGTLTIRPSTAGLTPHKDVFNHLAEAGAAVRAIPPVSITLVQDGDALIPSVRGAQPSDSPQWEWVVEPGRVWSEPGDDGWTRAALPFALQEKNANCTHYGLITFLFRDGQVSQGTWQIGSETCAYFQFDAWGRADLSLAAGAPADRERLVAGWRDETARRLPVRTFAQLSAEHPGIDPAKWAAEKAPGDVTAYGLVIDGVHYVSDCQTRAGAHPYCDTLDLPSYSVAKSLFGGLALMRANLLDPGVRSRLVSDLVPECAAPAWRGVTVENALDMATGLWVDPAYMKDEDSDRTWAFLEPLDHASRIRLACTAMTRRGEPGRRWVYHTSDTYIVGAALTAWLREKEEDGRAVDIYRDLVAEPLWRSIHLSPVAMTTRRTYDAAAQPFTGYGLTFHGDDFARIGQFLQGGGQVNGRDYVDARMLAEAMQRIPDARGLEAGWPSFRYQNGFWARNVASIVGCPGEVWVPFLSGYGGVSVVLFPNGVTYWVVSDGHDHSWVEAARAVHRIRSLCP